MDFPLAGWAPYEALYGCAPPKPVLSRDSAVASLINNAPTTIFYRGEDQDPLSIALRDAKATKVPNSEWATMDVNGKLDPIMEGRPYTIYRLTRSERWTMGIPSGTRSQWGIGGVRPRGAGKNATRRS